MKRISAVVFPDTVPVPRVLIPLVLVFKPVVYCLPVENDDSIASQGSLHDEMHKLSLYSFYSPAPLGENRERFLHLVKDLQQRRDDYAAQLTHVSLAGISTASQPGSESKSSILSNLLSGHGINSKEQEMKEKLLWQARLVLKLGEQYDADQQMMAENMENIKQREQNLFAGMSQETESPFMLTGKLASLRPDSDGMQRLRLKAWSRIFAFGSAPMPPDTRLFTSTDSDAVDRLCEEHEKGTGKRPVAILKLSLPAICLDENRFLGQLQKFLHEGAHHVEDLSKVFVDPSTAHSEIQAGWDGAIDNFFPQQNYGRCQLTLYSFQGVRTRKLFLDSFGYDEDEFQAELVDEQQQDLLIGLLSEQ